MRKFLGVLVLIALPSAVMGQVAVGGSGGSLTGTGTISANTPCPGAGCVEISTSGGQILGIEITGISGTVVLLFEGKIGTTYVGVIPVVPLSIITASDTPGKTGANGTYRFNVAGFTAFRVRSTTFAGANITINYQLTQGFLETDSQTVNTSTVVLNVACASPCNAPETAGSTAKIDLRGRQSAGFYIGSVSLGTFTMQVEGSNDGLYFGTGSITAVSALTYNRKGTWTQADTGDLVAGNQFTFVAWPGMNYARVRLSAYTSGSIGIVLTNGPAPDPILPFSGKSGTQAAQRSISLGGQDDATTCGAGGGFPCHHPVEVINHPPTPSNYGIVFRQAVETSYSAGTVTKLATTNGTGPFFSICGSSTLTVRVQSIMISGSVATAAIYGDVVISKTSTATSAGTATALTKVPHDSTSGASTVNLLNYYTALGTAGSLTGVIGSQVGFFPITATVSLTQPVTFSWGGYNDIEAPVLRGTGQCLEASFGTAPGNVPTLSVNVIWTEK